jgi:benzoyl-CoA reductase/2-hydroxyglutaryl-CoA dehydratase subunit BcrC/BadD/HgdB
MMDQNSHLKYIDYIQNCGLPEDTCPYASQTPGVVLAGHSPVSNTCMVVANLACEAGYASYGLIEEYFGLPTYHVEIPYDFKTAEGKERVAEDLQGLIAFLEEHTGHTMDWDKLREILERENQITEMEMELFEMQRAELPPMPGDVLWQLHMIFVNAIPGTEMSFNLYQELQKLSRKAYAMKEPAVKNRKYRAILWNPPSFGYSHIWNWLERCWGVAIVNDMETFLHLPLIDTSTPDTMLLGLAEHYSNAPMSRNNRGPAENWLDDLSMMTSMYKPDFILDLNQMACRSSLAMNGVMKEWGRERNVPICFVDYNLYDMRVVSRQGVRDQINSFMLNVMKAIPLDESLLDFDDSADW